MKRDKVLVSRIMTAVKAKNTSPEIAFRKVVSLTGLRYGVHSKRIPGKPDIVFKKYKTLVFIDGDFWHGRQWKTRGYKSLVDQFSNLSNKKYWIKKIERNIERDKRVNQECRNSGWRVIRFWETDIKRQADKCVMKLMRKLGVYEPKQV